MRTTWTAVFVMILVAGCATRPTPGANGASLEGRFRLVRLECRGLGEAAPISGAEILRLNRALQEKRYLSLIHVTPTQIETEQRVYPRAGDNGFCEARKVAELAEAPRASFMIQSEKIAAERVVGLDDSKLCLPAEQLPAPRTVPFTLGPKGDLRTYRNDPPPGLCDPGLALNSIFERVL